MKGLYIMKTCFVIDEVGEVKKQFRVRGFEKDTDDLVIQYLFDTVEEVTEFLKERLTEV